MVCVHIELADWQAAHSIHLGTLTTQDSVDASRDAKNFIRFGQVQDIGSQISAADSLGLTAGQDITTTAARLSSQQGSVQLTDCPGCWKSADGLRIYRPPMPKRASEFNPTGVQANFVTLSINRATGSSTIVGNGHLVVLP